MRQLQFVGVSDDGAQLLFRDPASRDQFQVPLDDRLRAASRNDRSRLGQIELELSSTLRPREIQARIRAGETPEAVAAAADAPLQRVMRFAYPVLQEREQVTVEARRTRIRRSDSASRLGDQVDDRLVKQGIDPDTADWDAFRREDGSWWVTLRWSVGEKKVTAQWAFDLPGRTLTPADDVAAELQAEQPRRRPIAAVPFVPDEAPDEAEYDEAADYRDASYRDSGFRDTGSRDTGSRDGGYREPGYGNAGREPATHRDTGSRTAAQQPGATHPTRRAAAGREFPRRERPMRVARPSEPAVRAERPHYSAPDPDDMPPGPVSVVSAPQRRPEPTRPAPRERTPEQRPATEQRAVPGPRPAAPQPAVTEQRTAAEPVRRTPPVEAEPARPVPAAPERAAAPEPHADEPVADAAVNSTPAEPARTPESARIPEPARTPEATDSAHAPQPATAEDAAPDTGPAEESKTKAGRARKPKVPSWDDIVFGTRGRK